MRSALITGCSSGFGLLAAVEFAKKGFHTFATMRDPTRREALDRAAKAAGVDVEVLQLDVTDRASVDKAVAQALAHGPLDVVVNNAGYGIGGFFEDFEIDEIREQFATNFFGVLEVCHAVVPHMRERRSGTIINVSSLAGRMGQPAVTPYVSSKWALEGFSESLRLELLPYGVYVTLVEPGSFHTEIFEANKRVAGRARNPESVYFASATRMEALVDGTRKGNPRRVARLIVRVAAKRRPRQRYLVGVDAHVLVLLRRIVPARILERLIVRAVGHRAPRPTRP